MFHLKSTNVFFSATNVLSWTKFFRIYVLLGYLHYWGKLGFLARKLFDLRIKKRDFTSLPTREWKTVITSDNFIVWRKIEVKQWTSCAASPRDSFLELHVNQIRHTAMVIFSFTIAFLPVITFKLNIWMFMYTSLQERFYKKKNEKIQRGISYAF